MKNSIFSQRLSHVWKVISTLHEHHFAHWEIDGNFVLISAIETPGGNRILVKNIIAQQIIRKRGIFKKHLVCKNIY
jgi:hypothetical protein